MVVDTSAVIALLFDEPEADAVAAALQTADEAVMAAPTFTELAIVVEARTGPAGSRLMEQLLDEYGVTIVPLDEQLARRSVDGWRRFGKGRHPAGLNLGDCFAYALASTEDLPLLFVGADFAATDIEPALEPT